MNGPPVPQTSNPSSQRSAHTQWSNLQSPDWTQWSDQQPLHASKYQTHVSTLESTTTAARTGEDLSARRESIKVVAVELDAYLTSGGRVFRLSWKDTYRFWRYCQVLASRFRLCWRDLLIRHRIWRSAVRVKSWGRWLLPWIGTARILERLQLRSFHTTASLSTVAEPTWWFDRSVWPGTDLTRQKVSLDLYKTGGIDTWEVLLPLSLLVTIRRLTEHHHVRLALGRSVYF